MKPKEIDVIGGIICGLIIFTGAMFVIVFK